MAADGAELAAHVDAFTQRVRVAQAIVTAGAVVTAYGVILDARRGAFASVAALPHPPDVIRDALMLLARVMPPAVLPTLRAGYVSLERFLEADEWALVAETLEYAGRGEAALIEVGHDRAAAAAELVARKAEAADRRLAEFEALERALDARG
jgi:hypothetical protein